MVVRENAALISHESFSKEESQIYDTGSERAMLSCIMKKPELMEEARARIKPEQLYNEFNRKIYETMIWLHKMQAKRGVSTSYDVMSMLSAAKDSGKEDTFLSVVGGMDHLKAVEAAPANPKGFSNYMENVLTKSLRVQAYRASRNIQKIALLEEGNTGAEFLSMIEKEIFGVSSHRKDDVIVKIGEAAEQFVSQCVENRNQGRKPGIHVEFLPQLMKVLNGIRRKQFLVLFARPKTGKSAFFLNIAIDVACLQNIPVLYIDTEMSEEEQLSRALASWSKVEEWDILNGTFSDSKEKNDALMGVASLFKDAPFYYSAARGISTEELVSRCRQFKSQVVGETKGPDGKYYTNPCLIMYDWLKVSSGSDSMAAMKEYQVLGEICTAIKDVANELDVPILAGAQANREGCGNNIDANAAYHAEKFLADSDRILRFCNCLMWLRRLSPEEEENVAQRCLELGPEMMYNQMLHVVDQRGGPTCLEGVPLSLEHVVLSYEEKQHLPKEEKQDDGDDAYEPHEELPKKSGPKKPSSEGSETDGEPW
jgi:replicative DNA helicase